MIKPEQHWNKIMNFKLKHYLTFFPVYLLSFYVLRTENSLTLSNISYMAVMINLYKGVLFTLLAFIFSFTSQLFLRNISLHFYCGYFGKFPTSIIAAFVRVISFHASSLNFNKSSTMYRGKGWASVLLSARWFI